MTTIERLLSRRNFLQGSVAVGMLGAAGPIRERNLTAGQPAIRRPQVAAVFTAFRYRSHAHVLLENFLEPYLFNGEVVEPPVDVVSFYADQFAKGDMAEDVARNYGIPLFGSIEAALCCGGDKMDVDAVLLIGEHGEYPTNELGQKQYPRKRFFDESVRIMHRDHRFVPVFNDKHLSYRWDWAMQMYETAQRYSIPLMAGSSVPLAQRRPPLELPAGSEVVEAVSIHGGGVESYDFHALEVLQSMIESRQGGETGIGSVEFLSGESLWQAARQGRWSPQLAEAAMRSELGTRFTSLKAFREEPPHGILLQYNDGLRAIVLKIGKSSTRWNFACRLKDEKRLRATSFYTGPWRNRCLFKALAHAIQQHFVHQQSPYPVERTLLTTGTLETAMKSRHEGRPLQPEHLAIQYRPLDFRSVRELGASWKIITEDLPPPLGFDPGTPKELLQTN